jgi:hypothetical protein
MRGSPEPVTGSGASHFGIPGPLPSLSSPSKPYGSRTDNPKSRYNCDGQSEASSRGRREHPGLNAEKVKKQTAAWPLEGVSGPTHWRGQQL